MILLRKMTARVKNCNDKHDFDVDSGSINA